MNQGQQVFHDFVMERAQAGKETEIEAIMAESFKRQDTGTFNAGYLNEIVPKMTGLLKPERVEEFKQAASQMRTQIANGAPVQTRFCQSCGMPFDAGHDGLIAREKDGSPSVYCTYCYKDGEFLNPGATVEDMVEMGVPHLAQKIGEDAARKQLSEFLPTLERWKQH
jgi:hypothetical protein